MAESYLKFIERQEGFRDKAYPDGEQYVIGFGTRTDDPDEISGAKTITEEEARSRLKEWTDRDREYISQKSQAQGLELNENELDSLTSFTYNTGKGNLDKLIEGRTKEVIAEKMKLYNKASGVEMEGLTRRRKEESELFTTPVQDASSSDRSFLDYEEPNIPMSILRETPKTGESPTAGEMWEAAKYRHWISESAQRQTDATPDKWDEGYRVNTEDLVKYNDAGYSKEELEFLSQSGSDENFAYRVERIESDREVKQLLEKGGMTGTGLEMLAGVADPAMIPTFFLGGAGLAGKWRNAKALGYSMLSGASQNAAAEYLLKMGDTQRTDEDMMLAVSAGALFSGTITAGAIGLRSARTRIDQANEIEAAHVDGVNDAMTGRAYSEADKSIKSDIPEAVSRKRLLSEKEIVSKLQEEVGVKADTLSSSKIKKAKEDLRSYKKSQSVKIDELKSSKIRPSSKNKQINQIQTAIDKREIELEDLIAENNDLLARNSKLDALQQGKIPESLEARYRELKMEEGEMTPNLQETIGDTLPKRKGAQLDEEGNEIPDDKSVGAMQTRRQFSDIATHDALLPDTEIDEIYNAVRDAAQLGYDTPRVSRLARKAKGFRSLSTQVDSAPDDATRGLGIKLLKNGTRTIEGHQSAEELAETLFFRNTPDYMISENAFDQYAKGLNIGLLGKGRQAAREEFDKQVVLLQATHQLKSNAHVSGESPIMQAAKARSRIYERGLQNNKDYGVIGFDKIKHSHSYHSVVYKADNILAVEAHADNIVDVIAKSYQNGAIKLTRENALRLANTQLERTFSYRSGGNGTFKKAMSDAEYKLLDKELEEAGVDATTRAELKSSLFNKEDLEHLSPRAMFSLKPDLTATSGDVRMVDLIDTSIDRVMKYASDSSANAGLASHGFKSRNQFLRAMEEARTQGISELRSELNHTNPKVVEAARKGMQELEDGKYQNLMDDAVKLMYREPLDSGVSNSVEDLSKILRKQTSITRLRSTGLMSIPENAIAMARNGALNTLAQIPKTRYFDLRTTSVEKDKFMNDFAQTFSATGHQEYLFGAKFYNNSDFDDATKSKLGNFINKVQGKAMNITMTVNAFRTFQHGGEEMVARSIVNNLKELSVKGEMTPNIKSSLVKVGGLSVDQVDQMIAHFKSRPDTEIFESVRQMEPELYNAVSVAARNTIGSSFMRMGIGESVPYANRELGKIVTSLLNFSIGSWEKMVVRGIKSDGGALMASMFAGQAALALLSQYAYVYSRAAGKEGPERDAYIEKNLNDESLFWGVMNRVGFLAAPSIPLQMLASARLLPEEISASPTKAGISPAGIPSVSMGADLTKATGSTADLIADKFNDEYMTDKERERNWKNIRRVLPWIDSPVYNFTIGQFD